MATHQQAGIFVGGGGSVFVILSFSVFSLFDCFWLLFFFSAFVFSLLLCFSVFWFLCFGCLSVALLCCFSVSAFVVSAVFLFFCSFASLA